LPRVYRANLFGPLERQANISTATYRNDPIRPNEIAPMKLQQVSDNCFAVLNEKNRVCDASSSLTADGAPRRGCT
jgi:hypothetical protein